MAIWDCSEFRDNKICSEQRVWGKKEEVKNNYKCRALSAKRMKMLLIKMKKTKWGRINFGGRNKGSVLFLLRLGCLLN